MTERIKWHESKGVQTQEKFNKKRAYQFNTKPKSDSDNSDTPGGSLPVAGSKYPAP